MFISSITYAQTTDRIDSIIVKQIPWNLLMPADVNCQEFENTMSHYEYCINDSNAICDIINELRKLERSKRRSMDVRCKICFYAKGVVSKSACIDHQNILYDGELYRLSKSLKNKIDCIKTYAISKRQRNAEFIEDKDLPFPNGRDSLNRYLQLRSDHFYAHIDKPVSLTVTCKIDSKGNTINVNIRNNDDSPENKQIKEILLNIFTNEIKWLPNKERFPYEIVSIPIRFVL